VRGHTNDKGTATIQAQIKKLQEDGAVDKTSAAKIAELKRSLPPPLPAISTVLNKERTPIHLLKRGDADRKSAAVLPRPLSALVKRDVAELPADVARPRTHLATWLNEPGHPLVPRVYVNRQWQ
jgi:hypothetical protein